MSATQISDRVRLEELRNRFDRASFDHPSVDGVVVYRPDLRREEAERQARILYVKSADPAAEEYNQELCEQTRTTYTAIRCAMDWERWIPPSNRSLNQLGGQMYWACDILADKSPEVCGTPTCIVWQCTLFGPPAAEVENTALHLFNLLAAEAARLILPQSKAEGKALLSRWLIHLADRPEPIVPDSRRRYLAWLPIGGKLMPPIWVPVTPKNPPTSWWAVRLVNVFQLSRVAIEQAIDFAAGAHHQEKNTLPADKTDPEYQLRLVGEVWRIRYRGEEGDYPAKGNQCLAWLAKLLTAPKRSLTIAELRGDPENKLAADAMLGAERETDWEGIAAIKLRIQEIEDISDATGGSETLQEEKAHLLGRLVGGPQAKNLNSQLRRDHRNIATQLRNFRCKLEANMPQLAAHLKAFLKLDFPGFAYYPPEPRPNWQF